MDASTFLAPTNMKEALERAINKRTGVVRIDLETNQMAGQEKSVEKIKVRKISFHEDDAILVAHP